jgi:hypothetical protein
MAASGSLTCKSISSFMDGNRLHTLWADCKNVVHMHAFVHQAKYGFELYSLLVFMSLVKCAGTI